ncbi:ABC transporter permease [Rhodococcus aetherivorans]|uniref:ABC transporter permease n=1 Tax=Rhodococcus aetherivorans TaxID=191292 RepID=UPI001E38A97E|nr:ABC transporter permease subunit [Rhodococcus aetherivorans]MDV6296172.1 ABC transporter permease subunit [Rhodococcus aetherivorans]UGQ43572.1 ABC transporter permease subunit [Rhodococcus aetherivorans]
MGLLVPLTAIAVWQLLVSAEVLDYEYLPAPHEVADALVELVRTGELVDDLAHTLGVALTATVITLTVGGALGLVIGLVPALRKYSMASIDVLRTIPAVALVPVAVLTFGPAVTTELILAVYAALWPILLHTAAGVAAVHPRQYDVARTLHVPPATTVRKIVIPAVVPAWLVGARLAAVIALLVAIAAEMIISPRGLGGGLIESLNALAPARMWAYALVAGAVGYLLNAALREVVRSGLPGSPAYRTRDVTSAADRAGEAATTPLRGLVPLAMLLIVWQLIASDDSLSFPPPHAWLRAIARMYGEGVLSPAIRQTLTTFMVALAVAALLGAIVGIAIGASPRIDRALSPTIDFLAAVPGAAFVPVAVLLLGTSPLSGVAVVALVVSWPILLNTATAMRAVPAVRLEMSRMLGLSTGERWRKVILPTLVPGIMLGVRVAASMALIITLLVEILGAGEGVGRLFVESQQKFDTRAVWGLLLIVGTVGYLTSATLARVEAKLTIPAEWGSAAPFPTSGVRLEPRI